MKNPLKPFFLIMVVGLILMVIFSVKGIGDREDLIASGGKTEVSAVTPEEFYQQTCVGCHGADYSGGVGPDLRGLTISADEIKKTITEGKGTMPAGLVPADKADEIVQWLQTLKK